MVTKTKEVNVKAANATAAVLTLSQDQRYELVLEKVLKNPGQHILLLEAMEADRLNWEVTELAQSNNRLYGILKQAYKFYISLKTHPSDDTRKAMKQSLENFITQKSYSFTPSSHDMTRIVKCVFGVDRRRVSAYSIALREALRQEVEVDDLVDFIQDNGGVEQIRMGGTKPMSTKKRAELGTEVLGEQVLSKVKLDPLKVPANVDWNDQRVVFVATYRPTGDFEINAVIKHEGAVNTALAAHFSLTKAQKAEAEKKKKEIEAIAAKQAASNAARTSAIEASKHQAQLSQQEKQIAKVAKEKAEREKIEAATKAFEQAFALA
jgi:hypothetical protein